MAIQFHCAGCGQPIEVDDEYAGRVAVCPHCRQVTSVPSASTFTPGGGASPREPEMGAPVGGGTDGGGVPRVPPTPSPVDVSPAPRRGQGLAHYAFICTAITGLLFLVVVVASMKLALQHGSLATRPSGPDLEQLMKELQSSSISPWLSAAGCGMLFFAVCGLALAIAALVRRSGLGTGTIVGLAFCLLFCGGVLVCNCVSVFVSMLVGAGGLSG